MSVLAPSYLPCFCLWWGWGTFQSSTFFTEVSIVESQGCCQYNKMSSRAVAQDGLSRRVCWSHSWCRGVSRVTGAIWGTCPSSSFSFLALHCMSAHAQPPGSGSLSGSILSAALIQTCISLWYSSCESSLNSCKIFFILSRWLQKCWFVVLVVVVVVVV